MRLSEQYGLSWDCVHFDRKIPRSKNGELRYVWLNPEALAALRTVEKFRNEQPWVFLNRYGQKQAGPREWFEACVKNIKMESVTWHGLRHTFASIHVAPKHQLAAVERLCDTDVVQKDATDTKSSTSDLKQAQLITNSRQ